MQHNHHTPCPKSGVKALAALAVSRWIEEATGWSIKKFVTTARRYRTTYIKVGNQTLPAQEPLPDDLAAALRKINAAKLASSAVSVFAGQQPFRLT